MKCKGQGSVSVRTVKMTGTGKIITGYSLVLSLGDLQSCMNDWWEE